jgi:GrpB-like predicted nucleotidyltransferase (UPF0157 family)
MFEAERELIMQAAQGLILDVVHIGSTAIPGMRAKPIIDVCALVGSLDDAPACMSLLRSIEYYYAPYAEDREPERRWFCKPHPAARTHHLHLTPRGSRFHRDRVAFRDFLRQDSEAADRYRALKERLALHVPDDREAYTDAKSDFVRDVLLRAACGDGGP